MSLEEMEKLFSKLNYLTPPSIASGELSVQIKEKVQVNF